MGQVEVRFCFPDNRKDNVEKVISIRREQDQIYISLNTERSRCGLRVALPIALHCSAVESDP